MRLEGQQKNTTRKRKSTKSYITYQYLLCDPNTVHLMFADSVGSARENKKSTQ